VNDETRDVWLIRHGEAEWTVSRRHQPHNHAASRTAIGNRLRRMVIGLGSGQSKVNTVVQVIQKTDQGSTEILDFETTADSDYMPGAGITRPAGAAAGGATAAALLGVNLAAGGVKTYTSSTGFLADKTRGPDRRSGCQLLHSSRLVVACSTTEVR
jgi:Domain of unknown function (DUF4410)